MIAPYYSKDGITLYCCDNRDIEWPEADLILTDPPYSAETHKGASTNPPKSGTADETGRRRFLTRGNAALPLGMDFAPFTLNDLCAFYLRAGRVARRWVVAFQDYRHIDYIECYEPPGLRFVRRGLWIKPNSAPQFTGDRPGMGYETIAFLHREGGRLRWNGGGKHGVYTCNIVHQNNRISDHPNAKPIPLLAELIKDFSDPGDLVLDPFAGSGAVLAAAKLTGRRAIGIERDERHCEALAFWLDNGRPVRYGTVSALPLFDEVV